ncbi:MAG: hypothetical protein HC857_01470 [Synechococcales cyanobacterium RU_4_20]|nr:hypothetical protein [Synechococcales cyanobacterium RU_4_20]
MTQDSMQNLNQMSDSSADPSTSGGANLSANAELLQNVLEAGLHSDATYPWNPSEAYFFALEQAAPELEIPGAESEVFFAKLEALWKQDKTQLTQLGGLLQRLSAQTIRLPQEIVEAIAARATELVGSPLSAIDQLVQCVQESLPQWDVEDLQVMARPYAFAMRGQEVELPEDQNWEEISEMEQGRLAMAIAHWILTEQENRG